ncbi:signal peptide peptidase SppA [Candidatus Binatia bacterium]|nr:signal peptide peptidase SppA [Candidatus Binatia bacterium]
MRRRTRYLLLVALLIAITAVAIRVRFRGPAVADGSYLVLDFGGEYAEGPPQDLLGTLLYRREPTMVDVLTLIRGAQVDSRIKGIIARITNLDVGWAKVQDFRDALIAFRESGKTLVALLEQEVRSANREYYLATAANRIYVSPNGTAPLNGLAAQFLFLGGVWEKLDVEMTVEKIGEYKSMGDMLANRRMTAAHREMANALLDSVSGQLVAGIAAGRDLQPERVRALIDSCPVSAAEFAAAGLADGSKYLDEIRVDLGGPDAPLVTMEDYARVPATALGLGKGPQIGVVFGVGMVAMGESGTGVNGQVLGAATVSKAIAEAAADDGIRAILLRIDSPGGSALASDLIWRATQDARQKKPIVVSMSDIAGSGGYYIAAGANRIVAQPATLTGSIGVVVARPNIEGLLGRLGINTETISRGRVADLDILTTPLSVAGRARLVEETRVVYDVFVDRVASGRNLSRERVDEIGRGRVWTGAQAKEVGLVDELGGLHAAIEATRTAAGIDSLQEVELVYYPRRKSVVERLGDLVSAHTAGRLPQEIRLALGTLAVPFADGTLLAVMPAGIDIR